MRILTLLLCLCVFASCRDPRKQADMIVHNAVVYTVDKSMSVKEAFAVKDGKILAVGTNDEILAAYEAKQMIDAGGKPVYPGFIDAHCHFLHYGLGKKQCDLVGTTSWNDVIKKVNEYAKTCKSDWIIGRGWDQNDWAVKQFPTRRALDSLFPNRPVLLERIDGHAVIANGEALRRAKMDVQTTVNGGSLGRCFDWNETNSEQNTIILSGLLVDNAVDLVKKAIPRPTAAEYREALLLAQKNCFAVGLTTVDDAGLMKYETDVIDSLQKINELKMRVYAMMLDSSINVTFLYGKGQQRSSRLTIRAFKFYADGALGSRGALLMKPYSDSANWRGLRLVDTMEFWRACVLTADQNLQMCTHCIGDSAVHMTLDLYGKALDGDTTLRWRIEHAQVVAPEEVALFGKYHVIPSVQPTHATSDMYWAKDRLGERIKDAYAYKALLKSAGCIALGTDFPVEDINPMYTFYAATARMDLKGYPAGGFQPENALTREETLKGMTIWAAYANTEEKEKGSLEAGKLADFVILDQDIMKTELKNVPHTKVVATYINGEKVFGK